MENPVFGPEMTISGLKKPLRSVHKCLKSRKSRISPIFSKISKIPVFGGPGGRPYRPLFTGKPCTMPTESLGPWKPDFQKRPLAGPPGKTDFFRLFWDFPGFSRKSPISRIFDFSLVLHTKKSGSSTKTAVSGPISC